MNETSKDINGMVLCCCFTCAYFDDCNNEAVENITCRGWGASNESCESCKYNKGDEDVLRHPSNLADTTIKISGLDYCVYCATGWELI